MATLIDTVFVRLPEARSFIIDARLPAGAELERATGAAMLVIAVVIASPVGRRLEWQVSIRR